jgi:hypothetical protein
MKHGRNSYNYHGCRCDVCRAGHAAYHRAYRKRGVPEDSVHGSNSTYANHRCRCEPCRKAHSEAMRVYRSTKKQSRVFSVA